MSRRVSIVGRPMSPRRWVLAVAVFAFVEVVLLSFTRQSVLFYGDMSAKGASVYVDGDLIGSLPTTADSFAAVGSVYHEMYPPLDASVRRGRHSLMFVSRTGDTLTGQFVPKLVSLVSVSFAMR